MKKMYTVVAVLALTLPVLAWGASQFTTSIKDGTYNLKITKSVLKELNGSTGTATVKHEGNNVVMTVDYKVGNEPTREVWTFDDKTLTQRDIDLKTNKVAQEYKATATKTPTGAEQSFNVNCTTDPKTNSKKCDADSDPRFYWTLKAEPTAVKYLVFGVDKAKKGDPMAKAEMRHEFVFTPATK